MSDASVARLSAGEDADGRHGIPHRPDHQGESGTAPAAGPSCQCAVAKAGVTRRNSLLPSRERSASRSRFIVRIEASKGSRRGRRIVFSAARTSVLASIATRYRRHLRLRRLPPDHSSTPAPQEPRTDLATGFSRHSSRCVVPPWGDDPPAISSKVRCECKWSAGTHVWMIPAETVRDGRGATN